jgi:hypothetical protein
MVVTKASETADEYIPNVYSYDEKFPCSKQNDFKFHGRQQKLRLTDLK